MEGIMRINKYIASAGICSRRKADDLVANGNVRINGVVVKEAGAQVGEGAGQDKIPAALSIPSERQVLVPERGAPGEIVVDQRVR